MESLNLLASIGLFGIGVSALMGVKIEPLTVFLMGLSILFDAIEIYVRKK